MRVTAIIPVYNEEHALPHVLQELPRALVHDVIVVDNGSTDRTFAAAQSAHVKVMHEPRRGYGQACRSGLHAVSSDTDVVVFLDGGHSDYPADVSSLLAPIERGEADLVIGSRVLSDATLGALTAPQRLGNWLACRLMSWRFGRPFTDLGSLRAVRYRAAQALQLQDRGFGWNVEMQLKALKAGLRVVEVPVRYRLRIGPSKAGGPWFGTARAGWAILATLARYW